MRNLITMTLFLTLIACSIPNAARKGKQGSQQDRIAAIEDTTTKDPNKKAVYFFRRKQGPMNGLTMAVFVNKKLVARLKGRNFSKVELPVGKHLIEVSYKEMPASDDPQYDQPQFKNVRKYRKYMEKVIQIYPNTGTVVQPITFITDDYNPGVVYYFKEKTYYGDKNVKNLLVAAQYVFPEPVSIDEPFISPRDKEQWNPYANTTSITSLDEFIERYPNNHFVAEAKVRQEELMANEKEEYAAAKKANTLRAYGSYLDQFPSAHNKSTVLKLMATRMNKPATYNLYAETHPDIIQYYPSSVKMDYSLMRVGPDNMQVKDILAHYKGGLGTGTLSAKIKATNAEYKDFSIKEIKHLKKRGVHEKLIEAMIESTAEHKRQLKMAQQNKAMMAQIQELIKKSQVNVGTTGGGANATGADKNMPVECLKLKAALTACKQTGGLLALACESTARASFTCNVKI